MNTRFLETFITLAELENFRATSRVLHATPAAVSLRIKALENELKTELIDRSTPGFRLTPAGQSLLGHARKVVDAARSLRAAAGQEIVVGGKLRLGVIETVVHSWLAHYISYLNTTYPQLEVDLTVDSSAVLQRRLLAGDLDLAIRVEGIDCNRAASRALASYPVRWIARRGLLPRRQRDLITRVLQRPILTFGRGTAPQVALENIVYALARQENVSPDSTRITCSPSVAAIVQLVRDGYGVAAMPSLIVADELQSGEFVELPLKPVPPPIVISLCKPTNANTMINTCATAAHVASTEYCRGMHKDLIEAL
jgi:DNA-binding transcriptional LysR family regulator